MSEPDILPFMKGDSYKNTGLYYFKMNLSPVENFSRYIFVLLL